jgi:hypothetical protein
MLGTFGAIREVDRLWLQFQHTPNFRECGFSVSALLLGEPCAFGVEPKSLFLFWAELLQSRAHKRELNPLEPIRRFARLHAEILPPAGRNLPQGRERESACPVGLNGQAWLQQVWATEAEQSIPRAPRNSC